MSGHLEQFDPQTGFGYFEKYEGVAEGKAPGVVQDEGKVARRERPNRNDRRQPGEPVARTDRRGPRNEGVQLRKSGGSLVAPIDDEETVIV